MPDRRKAVICWLIAGCFLGASVLGWEWLRSASDPVGWYLQDFVEYWAAGRLNFRGQNPYDPALLFAEQRLASANLNEAIMMWNPPWTLCLVAPFSLLPARPAHLAWTFLQLCIIVACAGCIWRLYGGTRRGRSLAWVIALAFAPVYFTLHMGQISPIVLLGITGFLHFQKREQFFAAGAALALASIKPHMVLLVALAVGLWAIDRKRGKVILGAATALIVLSLPPVIANPQIMKQYCLALGSQPPQMLSPTIGSLLRLVFGIRHFRLQFLPAAFGIIWLIFYYRQCRNQWDWAERMPLVLLVSFLVNSYGGWVFDAVVLLLPVLQVSVWLSATPRSSAIAFALIAFTAFDFLAFLLRNIHYSEQYWYAWMTPLLLYSYIALKQQIIAPSAQVAPPADYAGSVTAPHLQS